MSQSPFRPFSRRGDRMFQRGVAAAIGGQRMAAAGLLRQAVRLDPEHEQAWLWLSGVVDGRDEVALCLRAVLRINPDNERARQGLAQLDSWVAPATSTPLTARDYLRRLPTAWNAEIAARQTTAWWLVWRDARIALRSLIILLWLLPLILFAITGSLRAVIEFRALPDFVTYRDLILPTAAPASQPQATSPRLPVDVASSDPPGLDPSPTSEPLSIVVMTDNADLEAYFREITQQRDLLQLAVKQYRAATAESRTVLARVVAARRLNDEVSRAYTALVKIEPPTVAEQPHRMYLEGLTNETQALQHLMTFYSNYDPTAANRAALRLQDAHEQIANARAGWDALAQQLVQHEGAATNDRVVSPRPGPTQSPVQPRQSPRRQPDQ